MRKIIAVILTLVILSLLSFAIAQFFKKDGITDKIAVIPIEGVISIERASFLEDSSIPSNIILEFLDQASKDNSIKGIILEINSPGGTVVASKEIADKVKAIDKPVVALIREVGASGSYWIASAADAIVADPLSITGSIGVSSSYLEFSGLLDKYGISYERLTTGEFKDTGSPFRKLETKEREFLQKKIGMIHSYFISAIVENRNLPLDKVTDLADGSFYLGEEALSLGLIDYLGNKDLAINITKQMANIPEAKLVTYQKKESILSILSRISYSSSFFIGRGIGYELQNNRVTQISPVL